MEKSLKNPSVSLDVPTHCASTMEKPHSKVSKAGFIVSRYVIAALSCMGGFLMYALRAHFNVAMVAMVNHTSTNITSGQDVSQECSANYDDTSQDMYNSSMKSTLKEGEFNWSPSTQGIVLGAFYWGYAATQILGGRFGELLGAKWISGTGVLGAAIMSLITPPAARLHVAAVVLVRFLVGASQGIIFPAFFALFARWMPQQERSTMLAILNAGTNAGNIISIPIAAYLCEHGFAGGWPSVFYIFGMVGCVWFLAWILMIHNTPEDHPSIADKELSFILTNRLPVTTEKEKPPVPWKKILTSGPVWAITIAKVCGTWGFTTLMTKLPAFLQFVLHFPMQKTGFVISLGYVAQCTAMAALGFASDFITSKRIFPTTTVRKAFEAIALIGPALCLASIPLAGCNYSAVCALIIMSMMFYGFISGGDQPAILEMAPDFAGTLFGLTNTISGATGILSPVVAGLLIDENQGSSSHWMRVFFTAAGIYVFGAIVFVIWGSAELQEWGEVAKLPQKQNNTVITNNKVSSQTQQPDSKKPQNDSKDSSTSCRL